MLPLYTTAHIITAGPTYPEQDPTQATLFASFAQ